MVGQQKINFQSCLEQHELHKCAVLVWSSFSWGWVAEAAVKAEM